MTKKLKPLREAVEELLKLRTDALNSYIDCKLLREEIEMQKQIDDIEWFLEKIDERVAVLDEEIEEYHTLFQDGEASERLRWSIESLKRARELLCKT